MRERSLRGLFGRFSQTDSKIEDLLTKRSAVTRRGESMRTALRSGKVFFEVRF